MFLTSLEFEGRPTIRVGCCDSFRIIQSVIILKNVGLNESKATRSTLDAILDASKA